MIRVIFVHGLLFLLPFMVYAGVLMFHRRVAVGDRANWSNDTVTWLTLAGMVLTIIGFLALGVLGGADPDSVHRPSEFRDGVVVPGGFESPDG